MGQTHSVPHNLHFVHRITLRSPVMKIATLGYLGCITIGTFTTFGQSTNSGIARFASIAGKVLDSSAEPRLAEVDAYLLNVLDGHTELLLACAVQTTQVGTFECPRLQSGTYFVAVRPQILATGAKKETTESATFPPRLFFYGGTTDFEAAEPVHLSPGDTTWCDMRLPESPGWRIVGDASPFPANTTYRLRATRDSFRIDTELKVTRDPKSNRILVNDVPPGHYTLVATWQESSAVRSTVSSFTVTNADFNAPRFFNQTMVVLRGKVEWPDGAAPSQITLYRCDGTQARVTTPIHEGKFAFPAIQEGEYFIGFPVDTGLYAANTTVGTRKSEYRRLIVASEAGIETVTVETERTGLQVEGTIKDWQGDGSTAQIVLISQDTGQAYPRGISAGGKFQVKGLPPGSYMAFAWPLTPPVEYRNLAVIKARIGQAATVKIEANQLTFLQDLPLSQ
jgi:hypothetical protein